MPPQTTEEIAEDIKKSIREAAKSTIGAKHLTNHIQYNLDHAVNSGAINGYNSIHVDEDGTAHFTIQPVYALNYVTLTVNVDIPKTKLEPEYEPYDVFKDLIL